MHNLIKITRSVGFASFLALTTAPATPVNLLVNPGFETGNFSGWTIGGNSLQSGVAVDGTYIPGEDAPFFPNFQNVRSGAFAGNALVQGGDDPVERIILSQTVSVLPNQNVNVGFWLGNDSQSAFGMPTDDAHTQIFIDGVGLLANNFAVITAGSGPSAFSLLSGSFNTGTRSSINVDFSINGSGTSRVGASFDDFFFQSENAPEPTASTLLGLGITALLSFRCRQRRL